MSQIDAHTCLKLFFRGRRALTSLIRNYGLHGHCWLMVFERSAWRCFRPLPAGGPRGIWGGIKADVVLISPFGPTLNVSRRRHLTRGNQ
jgi:hypothetical protein